MRNECVRAIEQMALDDPKVMVVVPDPAPDFMRELAHKHPERLMIEGVCEQAVAGVAAGLASEGFYPFIIQIAVFGTRRCYEQLLLDFALHRYSGCMVGIGAGLSYSMMGPTHIAVDDMALISCVPDSAILSPAEPREAVTLIQQARWHSGLSYLRLTATADPLLHGSGEIVLGKGRLLAQPGPLLFISCGAATLAVEQALAILETSNIRASALHLHTVKPLDKDLLIHAANAAEILICVEEHRQLGGLSSAVLHTLAASGRMDKPLKFASVGVDDGFPEGFGTHQEMMAHYGISGPLLAQRARGLFTGNTHGH